ncbi:MAG TPA: helix-turn-helix domain-containing protein [Candidatus Saccharimonadales bacterium]|nr:helix-turn-helix domain-containing protein [Candidatus Saccharimonadales bacterium]
MTRKGWFDTKAFYEALDGVRLAKSLNWRQVATESGVSASTLTRMAQGKRPDVDGLAALAAWSGLETDEFVRTLNERPHAENLGKISTYLRSDKNLSPEAAEAIDQLVKATYKRMRKDNQKTQ